MRKRGGLVLALSTFLLGGVVAAGLFVFSPTAGAEGSDIYEEGETGDVDPHADDEHDPPSIPPEDLPGHVPGTLYPAGEGDDALSYDDLDEVEKKSLDDAALWAETGNGHAVHNKWAKASAETRKRAKANLAQTLSGTQGLDELGVN